MSEAAKAEGFVKVVDLSKKIYISPHHLNNDKVQLQRRIVRKLRDIEYSTCYPSIGFVMKILNKDLEIEDGIIDEENSGDVVFNVSYKAECLKPAIGDIVRARLMALNEICCFGKIIMSNGKLGPITFVIPRKYLPEESEFNNGNSMAESNYKLPNGMILKVAMDVNIEVMYYEFTNNTLLYLGKIHCI
jgi:DNA-directed RNA polymerase subunit E'/Rpb7